jgi:peptidoglycan/LPS O-acetylase OafA/YrhL
VIASEPVSRPRIQGLDLLRGLAIGLVMLRHAAPDLAPGAGVVGVVIFFALSGYLITGLLHDELSRTGRVDLRRFYVRRARRLVPALLFLVAGVVVVTLTLDPLGDRDELARTVLVALTWTGNLPFGHASDATFHLWTLATEEQFYLLWPAVLTVGFAARRTGVALALSAAACVLACVVTVLWLSEAPDLAYALPTSWAVCFVIGAAARLFSERMRPAAELVLVDELSGRHFANQDQFSRRGAKRSLALLAWQDWREVQHPALRPLVWLGTVSYAAYLWKSYAAYLWNYPLTLWLRPHLGVAAGLAAAAGTLVLAAVSWRLVEQPTRSDQKVLAA